MLRYRITISSSDYPRNDLLLVQRLAHSHTSLFLLDLAGNCESFVILTIAATFVSRSYFEWHFCAPRVLDWLSWKHRRRDLLFLVFRQRNGNRPLGWHAHCSFQFLRSLANLLPSAFLALFFCSVVLLHCTLSCETAMRNRLKIQY